MRTQYFVCTKQPAHSLTVLYTDRFQLKVNGGVGGQLEHVLMSDNEAVVTEVETASPTDVLPSLRQQ